MEHKIYSIITIKILAPYILELTFNDNTKKTINFKNILHGEMYSPLKDLNFFNQVKIDNEVKTFSGQMALILNPETLHDWEENESEFVNQSKNW